MKFTIERKKEKELLRICSKQQSTSNTLCTELFAKVVQGPRPMKTSSSSRAWLHSREKRKCRAASSLALVTEGARPH